MALVVLCMWSSPHGWRCLCMCVCVDFSRWLKLFVYVFARCPVSCLRMVFVEFARWLEMFCV
jgi:hypothetical protein